MTRKMKDSGIDYVGDIPSSWKIVPNKYVMKKKKDICDKWNNENVLSLTMNGVIIRDLINPVGKMPTTFDGYQYVYPNDLLMCLFDIDVTPRCIGIVKNFGVTSPAYSRFTLYDGYSTRYYYYYYLYLDNKKELLHLAKNLRHSFTEEELGYLKTPVPPLSEQQKIADFLDEKVKEIDNAIEKTKETIELLNKAWLSLLTEAVTLGIKNEKVTNKNINIGGIMEIKEDYHILKFKKVCKICPNLVDVNNYLDYLQISPDKIEKNTMRLFPCKTVRESGVISDNHLFYANQIIYSKIRPNLNKLTIAPFSGLCSADMYPIETSQNIKYIAYSMLSQYFTNQVDVVIHDRVKMPKINAEELSNLYLIIPPLDEQNDISSYLDGKKAELNKALNSSQSIIDLLKNYKKSLIYEYVTGKKEVK